MPLIDCLEKLGIIGADQREILAKAKEHQTRGLSEYDAAVRTIKDMQHETLNTLHDVYHQLGIKGYEHPSDYEKRKQSIAFAPFRATDVHSLEEDNALRSSPDYQKHIQNVQKLANGLGVKIDRMSNTWGGYKDSETGKHVQEISNVIQLHTTPEKAELMAAILGIVAPEEQDSVLVGHHNEKGHGREYIIRTGNFENGKKGLTYLKADGIENFTLDTNNGDIVIIDTDSSKHDNIINFTKELEKNHIYGQHEYSDIHAKFIGQGDFKEIIRSGRDKARSENGFDPDAFIQEAKRGYGGQEQGTAVEPPNTPDTPQGNSGEIPPTHVPPELQSEEHHTNEQLKQPLAEEHLNNLFDLENKNLNESDHSGEPRPAQGSDNELPASTPDLLVNEPSAPTPVTSENVLPSTDGEPNASGEVKGSSARPSESQQPLAEGSPEKLAKTLADKLRHWAELVEGDKTAFHADLLALPKGLVSTLLKGAANIIEAGGTIKEAIDHFVDKVKDYLKEHSIEFDEPALRGEVKDLYQQIGILPKDEELRGQTKAELAQYVTREGRKSLRKLTEDASNNGAIKEAHSLSKSLGDFLANSVLFKNKIFKGITDAFHPFLFDRTGKAREAYMKIREANSKLNQQLEVLDKGLRKQSNFWMKTPKIDRLGFILSMENPEKYGTVDPKFESYAKAYRTLFDHAFELISEVKDVKYLSDYFTHFWKDSGKADKVLAQINSKKPLEGSKSFLKQRFYSDYFEGIKAGLEPTTTNPAEIVMLAMRNAMRFKFAHDVLNELKDNKIVEFHQHEKGAPEGWRKMDDNLFNPGFKSKIGEEGYYAPEQVSRLINNFTSKGLFDRQNFLGGISNTVRWWNNLKNLFQLGFSPFHLFTTALETNVNGMAQGIKDITTGRPENMARGALQIVKTLSQVRTGQMLYRGNKIISDYRKGRWSEDVENLVRAGGRTGVQKIYSLDAWYNLKKSWHSMTVDHEKYVANSWKLLTNAVGFIPEIMMKPLMVNWVSALKIAGHAEALGKEQIRNPLLKGDERLKKSQRLWDDMDDSLGQVVYDNYFWDKTTKDLGFLAVRSLGWTGGTIKKIGKGVGGIVDSFVDIQNTEQGLKVSKGSLLRGEGLNIRTAWLLSLPLTVGFFGGLTHYLLSGQKPQELEDYFYPWDGTYNPDGTKHRVSLPTYLKDVRGYSTDFWKTIRNKLAPGFNEAAELYANKDFYSTQIYNPDDPLYQKGLDVLKYEAGTIRPFSMRSQPGQGVGVNPSEERKQHVEQFFGLMSAPKSEGRSELENKIVEEARKNYGDEATTKEQRERLDGRIAVKDLLRSGKTYEQIPKDLLDKANFTSRGIREAFKDSSEDPYGLKFKTLLPEQQLKLWGKMNEEEKTKYVRFVHKGPSFLSMFQTKPEVLENHPEYKDYLEEIAKYADR